MLYTVCASARLDRPLLLSQPTWPARQQAQNERQVQAAQKSTAALCEDALLQPAETAVACPTCAATSQAGVLAMLLLLMMFSIWAPGSGSQYCEGKQVMQAS
jgi:hypothetical protein